MAGKRRIVSNRPRHWHVYIQYESGLMAPAGVRMTAKERLADHKAGRRRLVRRWFTSASGARKLKDRLEENGRRAITIECRDPDWCRHGPPD